MLERCLLDLRLALTALSRARAFSGVANLLLMRAESRQRELAVRAALGATSHAVRRLVLGEGLRLAGIGAAIGAAGSLGVTGLVQSLLFETDARSPTMMAAAVLVMLIACIGACYIPVRRATRIDPCSLLQAE